MIKLSHIFEEVNVYVDKMFNVASPEVEEPSEPEEPIEQGPTEEEVAREEAEAMEQERQQELENAKAELLGLLQNTLNEMGLNPNDSVFENDIIRLTLDRSRFKLSDKIYIYLTDKRTGQEHEGFINISDLPTHFKTHKLFEAFLRFKKIIQY
jgi:hypothetical protein